MTLSAIGFADDGDASTFGSFTASATAFWIFALSSVASAIFSSIFRVILRIGVNRCIPVGIKLCFHSLKVCHLCISDFITALQDRDDVLDVRQDIPVFLDKNRHKAAQESDPVLYSLCGKARLLKQRRDGLKEHGYQCGIHGLLPYNG